ncbi:MAB_1171c family putative transporter [Streptomyces sp. URMC 123]|uniref:MAB_1171c family putative transporter n=1 Tax=Streptomyces sp. URMC 123 TaxID=3423403 RepID=UPI003F1ABCD7
MNAWLHPVCAVVAWLALAYKLTALRRSPRDNALIALCCVLGFSALSFTLSHPYVWRHVDRLVGVPNGAALLAMTCVMLLVASQQIVLEFWAHPPRRAWRGARLRMLTTALVLTTLVTLFSLMSPEEQRPKDFTLHYADHPLYAAYLLIYICAYAAGEIEVGRLAWRYAKVSHRLWLRRGLRLIAVGAWVTLGYSAIRITNIVGAPFGVSMRGWEPVAWICGDIGALLTLVGWTLPGWGHHLTAPHRWVRAGVQYRRLTPLWSALCAAVPAIALPAPRAGLWRAIGIRTLEFKLYRRVVEIRDGQLALRAYADPEVARTATRLGEAAGLDEHRVRAITEAAQLTFALRAHGLRASAGPVPEPRVTGPERADLAEETAWLVDVARAFARCPIVAAAAAARQPAPR